MRFFHLSDLHIGLRLYNYDLRQEQENLLHQVVEKVQQYEPDVLVIAGDIYDKSIPSAEAVHIFNQFLSELNGCGNDMAIMMVSGNHDSAERLDCFRSLLAKQQVYMVGVPPLKPEEHIEKVTVKDCYGDVNFYLLPFVKPTMVRGVFSDEEGDVTSYDGVLHRLLEREQIDAKQRNVFVSHQFYLPGGENPERVERMESEVVTVGNIDAVTADILEPFDYAALGHIHKSMKVGKEQFRYSGTPMAYSVSEEGQEKGILMVELKEKGEPVSITRIPLKPLRQVRKLRGMLDELLMSPTDDYVSITLTDKEDFEVVDMQEKLRNAFPHLLEIRRENIRDYNCYEEPLEQMKEQNPYGLFCRFFPEMEEQEKSIIQDVINAVKGGPE